MAEAVKFLRGSRSNLFFDEHNNEIDNYLRNKFGTKTYGWFDYRSSFMMVGSTELYYRTSAEIYSLIKNESHPEYYFPITEFTPGTVHLTQTTTRNVSKAAPCYLFYFCAEDDKCYTSNEGYFMMGVSDPSVTFTFENIPTKITITYHLSNFTADIDYVTSVNANDKFLLCSKVVDKSTALFEDNLVNALPATLKDIKLITYENIVGQATWSNPTVDRNNNEIFYCKGTIVFDIANILLSTPYGNQLSPCDYVIGSDISIPKFPEIQGWALYNDGFAILTRDTVVSSPTFGLITKIRYDITLKGIAAVVSMDPQVPSTTSYGTLNYYKYIIKHD